LTAFAFLVCAALAGIAAGADRKVAITIDDLVRGGDGGSLDRAAVKEMTARLLKPFRDEKIPVIGFVNEGRAPEITREILSMWLDAGADLGNHTYSHINFNTATVAQFIADLERGEHILRPLLAERGKKLEFLRHTYLHAGPTLEAKRALGEYLSAHGYRVAPVTFDDSDYMFAKAYTNPAYTERVKREYVPYMESVVEWFEKRSVEVVGREFPQVLLIHASEMNSRLMPDLLAMFKRRGYKFVSLNEALRDDAYRLPEEYAGPGGFSWIHRWSMTKKMPQKGEPDEPEWVRKVFEAK